MFCIYFTILEFILSSVLGVSCRLKPLLEIIILFQFEGKVEAQLVSSRLQGFQIQSSQSQFVGFISVSKDDMASTLLYSFDLNYFSLVYAPMPCCTASSKTLLTCYVYKSTRSFSWAPRFSVALLSTFSFCTNVPCYMCQLPRSYLIEWQVQVPPVKDLMPESFPLYRTNIFLSVRKAITILSSQAGTPISLSLVIKRLWI